MSVFNYCKTSRRHLLAHNASKIQTSVYWLIGFHFKMKWPLDKNLSQITTVQKNKNDRANHKEIAY